MGNEKTGVVPPGVGRWQTFTVTVTSGSGSSPFVPAITGKVFHRQVSPPNGAGAYSFYVQNSAGISHDVHTVTGLSDVDDLALWADETSFWIVNAANDGDYVVTVWVGE